MNISTENKMNCIRYLIAGLWIFLTFIIIYLNRILQQNRTFVFLSLAIVIIPRDRCSSCHCPPDHGDVPTACDASVSCTQLWSHRRIRDHRLERRWFLSNWSIQGGERFYFISGSFDSVTYTWWTSSRHPSGNSRRWDGTCGRRPDPRTAYSPRTVGAGCSALRCRRGGRAWTAGQPRTCRRGRRCSTGRWWAPGGTSGGTTSTFPGSAGRWILGRPKWFCECVSVGIWIIM